MKKFNGKKLLVLGTSVASVEIVKYAKSQGAFVIVTDYLPTEKSAAKKYADRCETISTTDIPALIEFSKKEQIDGVFCGVSEVNLRSVLAITEALNLPCYFNREQWDICQNKDNFKALCKKFDVPVPEDYSLALSENKLSAEDLAYPVIVKPIDQGAAVGIHICNNKEEFAVAYEDAYNKSFSHKVIVEQYVVGEEFSAAYTIINGEYRLSTMGDKYLNREQEGLLPLPDAYVYPSKHLEMYKETLSPNIINMFKSIGLKNGTVFVQGVTDGKNTVIFEAGLRMGGTALFRFVSRINGISIVELLTDYALTGKMEANIDLEDPYLKGKRTCLLSLLNRGGKIAKITGVEEASKVRGVLETVVRYQEGDTIVRSGTLKQSHIRFFVSCDSAKELCHSIETIQQLVSVKNEFGEEMLLSSFNTNNLIY